MSKMASVRSKNTNPELIIRKWLFSYKYRYNIHLSYLPGKPDIVFPRKKVAIFINGCFWHQHAECPKSSRPKTNTRFWNKKLDDNIQRDKNNIQSLESMGWKVIVIWECEIKNKLEMIKTKLINVLQS